MLLGAVKQPLSWEARVELSCDVALEAADAHAYGSAKSSITCSIAGNLTGMSGQLGQCARTNSEQLLSIVRPDGQWKRYPGRRSTSHRARVDPTCAFLRACLGRQREQPHGAAKARVARCGPRLQLMPTTCALHDSTVDELLRQRGIVDVDTLHALVDELGELRVGGQSLLPAFQFLDVGVTAEPTDRSVPPVVPVATNTGVPRVFSARCAISTASSIPLVRLPLAQTVCTVVTYSI